MADGIRIRQGVHNLDAALVAAFRDSYRQMMAIGDNRGYGFKAGLHGTPGNWCWHHQQNDVHFSGQMMQLFLPWHRAYLYDWEMAMRDHVPAITLPWWDWTLGPPRQSGLPKIPPAALQTGPRATRLARRQAGPWTRRLGRTSAAPIQRGSPERLDIADEKGWGAAPPLTRGHRTKGAGSLR